MSTSFDWDAPTSTPALTVEAKAATPAFDWDAPTNSAEFPRSSLIPALNAWIGFRPHPSLAGWTVETVDASFEAMPPKGDAFVAWKREVDASGGFAVPICVDASDGSDQARACFVAHGIGTGYANRREALAQFAKIYEATWAREELARLDPAHA